MQRATRPLMVPQYQQQLWMMMNQQPPQPQPHPHPPQQQFQQRPPLQQMYNYNQQPPPAAAIPPQYTAPPAAPIGGATPQPASADEIRTLWIGDLQYWMDEQYLLSCFAQTGEVVSAKVIRNKQSAQSEGYGFIEFVNRAAAKRHLRACNGTLMPNVEQLFRLNWATFGAGERRQDDTPDYTIFVGDLAADATDYTLQETFRAHYPSVKGAKVVIDGLTGRTKGYGFVMFGDESEQIRAMTEMSGRLCSTRPMRIGPVANEKNVATQQYPKGMTSENRNYRGWTSVEEAKLVEALVNMVNGGQFKADNGFQTGYLLHLEQILKQILPTSGLLGKPDIESKIQVMKKKWQIVHDLVTGSNTSGFGCDAATHCVVAEPDIWDAYLKAHKGASKWKNKVFPHYEDLCIVFGKDRTQSGEAKDHTDVEKQAYNEEETQEMDDDSDDIVESAQQPRSRSNVQEGTSTTQCKKRKNRVDLMIDVFQEAVMFLGYGMAKMSNKMSKRVEREEELDKKRSAITSEISKMKTLTRLEKFKAFEKIRKDDENVKLFWDLDDADKEHYVKYILEQ